MITRRFRHLLLALGLLTCALAGLLWSFSQGLVVSTAVAQSSPAASPYILLNQEFFEAMAKLNRSGVTYGDRQEPLLQQIATASQFMVKTNLTLIQQQERIIHLLEELNRKRLIQER